MTDREKQWPIDRMLQNLFICFLLAAASACSIKPLSGPEWFPWAGSSEYERRLAAGRQLVAERHHQRAIQSFDQAGDIDPQRPEWQFEKARAYFLMSRYPEAIDACRNALDRDPRFYEAVSFFWAVRLKSENSSPLVREAVRREIEALVATGTDETDALTAAYDGYQYLNDRPLQRSLILKLAQKAGSADLETREMIAGRLFEQTVQAKDDPDARADLLAAYVFHFPLARHTSDAVFLFLKTKQDQFGDGFNGEKFADILLTAAPESHPVKTGVAAWLIETNQNPERAVSLLRQSLVLAEKNPLEKPRLFKPEAWNAALDEQKDKIRLLLGRAWFNAGNDDEAAKILEGVAAQNHHWGDVYYYQAKIALAKGSAKKAVELFRQALEVGERDDEAHDLLRRLLAEEYGYEGDPADFFSRQTRAARFMDVTTAAGLGHVTAQRAAWGDFDRDGFDDLLLDGRRLFKNTGEGSFVDITDASGLGHLEKTNGGVWGDYNNDGRPDIFITGRSGNHLFENQGNSFNDQTAILVEPDVRMETEAAAWGDMDNDGFLDLYVANYEDWGVIRGTGMRDRLYRNLGGSRFSDVTDESGIVTDEAMCGRGVTWTDVNLDGLLDIVVANYRLDPNFLWMNQGTAFAEQADAFGVRGAMVEGAFGHSIGPVSGDLDNDGDLDLFITNLAHPRYIEFSDLSMMLINNGDPDHHFTDQYPASGIFFEETNADPALADVDNDGDLDLYLTAIYPGRYSHLYTNDGNGRFRDASWISGTRVENSWGAAFADYNNDGCVDLFVASADGVHLFENIGNAHHWVKVRIFDDRCNRFGIGARVWVKYGSRRQVREVAAGRGTGSQDSAALVFGLGDHAGPVEIYAETLCGDILRAVISRPDQEVVLTQ